MNILRSDDAKEFILASFQNYMNQYGILRQFLYVDKPSLNGVAERKNRPLLKRSMH